MSPRPTAYGICRAICFPNARLVHAVNKEGVLFEVRGELGKLLIKCILWLWWVWLRSLACKDLLSLESLLENAKPKQASSRY